MSKLYATEQDHKDFGMTYQVVLDMDGLPEWAKGRLLVAGFLLKEERDKYLAEWRDDEVATLESLTRQLWATDKFSEKKSLSGRIEKVKNAVQRRAGIVDT